MESRELGVWGRAHDLGEGLDFPVAAGGMKRTDGGHRSSGGRAEGDAANGFAAGEAVSVGEHQPSCKYLDPHWLPT